MMAGLQTQDETEAGIQFEQLIRRISLYLGNKPEEKYSLSKYFNEKGIPFPIQRLASNASYSRFQQYLNLTFIKESHKYKNDNVDIFLSEVEILSNKLFKLAATIKMPIDGNHPLLQKMLTQRLRYQINKLLYVTPIDKYSKILALIPNIPEFYEHKVIIRALITKNIAELIKIPGPATATFASIYKENETNKLKIEIPSDITQESLDSINTLLAFDVCSISTLPDTISKHNQEYTKFCCFNSCDSRLLKDYSFEDEMRSLQLNITPEVRQKYFTERYSDTEQLNLDVLSINENGY